MAELFVVRLELGTGSLHIPYQTLDDCLSDGGLRTLFDDGLVTACAVYCGDTRILGLAIMESARFEAELVSHAAAILHHRKKETS